MAQHAAVLHVVQELLRYVTAHYDHHTVLFTVVGALARDLDFIGNFPTAHPLLFL
jgi:hypothetical protein